MWTRRQLLTLAGAVVGTSLLGGCLTRPGPNVGVSAQQRPFTIALLSDPHIHAFGSPEAERVNRKLTQAVSDLEHADLWVVNGDLTHHGHVKEYEAFLSVMARAKPLVVTTGNHEFYDRTLSDEESLSRFVGTFGKERAFSNLVAGGVHLVLLADEQYARAPRNPEWAWLSEEQLAWFDRVLTEYSQMPTVVCMHQPVTGTVSWSWGNSVSGAGQSKELLDIVHRHPQVKLWFSGHTHLRLEAEGQQVRRGDTWFIALGSTYYQSVEVERAEEGGGVVSGGIVRDERSSQSRVLEIYSDRLLVRARDHQRQRWLDELTVTVPLTKT